MPVELEHRGPYAVIKINRPEARNAINGEVAQGIEDAIDEVEADDGTWVGILTGEPPVFSAGADLKEINAGNAAKLQTQRGGFAGIVQRERTKPIIAAVDGPALAGGTEIVLACDLVVASTSATFGIPEVKRSLVAGAGGLFRLGRKLPLNIAMELAVTGDPITAEVAHHHGLVAGDRTLRRVEQPDPEVEDDVVEPVADPLDPAHEVAAGRPQAGLLL